VVQKPQDFLGKWSTDLILFANLLQQYFISFALKYKFFRKGRRFFNL